MSLSNIIKISTCVHIIQISLLCSLVQSDSNFQFDKNFVGVAFTPYVKQSEGYALIVNNTYTMDEVETMLLLISSKFRLVSTSSVGVTARNQYLKDGDAVGFTGIAAANLNKKKSSTVIRVILGVKRLKYNYLLDAEVNKAFSVAKEANRLHAGTVWGVPLTDRYVTNHETVAEVLEMIAKGKSILGNQSNHLRYGVRLGYDICSMVTLKKKKPEFLEKLLKSVDYIQCKLIPDKEVASKGVLNAAVDTMNTFDVIRSEMKQINPEIILIGETGWPSSGIYPDISPSIANMDLYWKKVAQIASDTKFLIIMHEAIDQPWKNGFERDKGEQNGPCGANGHFGWWRLKTRKLASVDSYVEKIREPQSLRCDVDSKRLKEMEIKDLENTRKAVKKFRFDENYFGVVFAPYVKNLEGTIYPEFDNYTLDEVEVMLLLVSSKFHRIATYDMGVQINKTGIQPWENGDAAGFSGIAAAKLNKKKSSTVLKVILGVEQKKTEYLMNTELNKTFTVTKEANSLHPGTIWGITFTGGFVKNRETADQVMRMIATGKQIFGTQSSSVKYGVSFTRELCFLVVNSPKKSRFLEILIKEVDYVQCVIVPGRDMTSRGVLSAAKNVMNLLEHVRNELTVISPKIIVIGETGWPSSGNNPDRPSSIVNMVTYWQELSKIASAKQIPIYMFAAFDEPWLNQLENDKQAKDGLCGSRAHQGWWRRKNNKITSLDAYVEKITEPQAPKCKQMGAARSEETELKSPTTLWTWIATLLMLLISFAIVIISLCDKFKDRMHLLKTEKLTEKEIEEFEKGVQASGAEEETSEIALRLPYDRKFELQIDQLDIDKDYVLGSGEFGIVYKGKIPMISMAVAIKTTKQGCSVQNIKSFLAEIKLMIFAGEHPNIVGFVGACTGDLRKGEVYIVSEFCSQGAMINVLITSTVGKYSNLVMRNNICSYAKYENFSQETSPEEKEVELSMTDLVKWSYHIASGMNYLASKKVIHADLATRNVLLTETGIAKITDFGLSRKLYEYAVYVKKGQDPLPWRWMSIESLRQYQFSSQSDVWSYGVTLWEIFSKGDVPYPGLSWHVNFVTELKKGLRLNKPKYASDEMFEWMKRCWHVDPNERPTFSSLADYFGNLLKLIDVSGDYKVLHDNSDDDITSGPPKYQNL